MKYIRTKDTEFRIGEILKVLHEDEKYYECEGTFEKRMGCKAYVKKEIVIKTADTIEELCDKFVMLNTNFGNIVVPDIEAIRFNLSKRGYVHYCSEIYGAIWTDKGLIYVAKMNDKGELELL